MMVNGAKSNLKAILRLRCILVQIFALRSSMFRRLEIFIVPNNVSCACALVNSFITHERYGWTHEDFQKLYTADKGKDEKDCLCRACRMHTWTSFFSRSTISSRPCSNSKNSTPKSAIESMSLRSENRFIPAGPIIKPTLLSNEFWSSRLPCFE